MKAINPRTGEADYSFEPTSVDALTDEAERLRAAQGAWEALGPDGRGDVLRTYADRLEAHSEAIVAALSVDTGRQTVARVEVYGVVENLRRWAGRAPELFAALPTASEPSAVPGIAIEPRFSAYPLFGAIAPWNFPLILSHIDAIPALAAGCAALVKPSEATPRFVEPLRAVLAEVPELPMGIVMGGPEIGRRWSARWTMSASPDRRPPGAK